jgi:hypothetical protein
MPPTDPRPCQQFPPWLLLGDTKRHPFEVDGGTPVSRPLPPAQTPFALAAQRLPLSWINTSLVPRCRGAVLNGSISPSDARTAQRGTTVNDCKAARKCALSLVFAPYRAQDCSHPGALKHGSKRSSTLPMSAADLHVRGRVHREGAHQHRAASCFAARFRVRMSSHAWMRLDPVIIAT